MREAALAQQKRDMQLQLQAQQLEMREAALAQQKMDMQSQMQAQQKAAQVEPNKVASQKQPAALPSLATTVPTTGLPLKATGAEKEQMHSEPNKQQTRSAALPSGMRHHFL